MLYASIDKVDIVVEKAVRQEKRAHEMLSLTEKIK